MTSLLALQTPTYAENFMSIYGFLFELWVLNLNEKKMKKKKKMNSAHIAQYIYGEDLGHPYTKHYFSSSHSDSIPITQEGSHIST